MLSHQTASMNIIEQREIYRAILAIQNEAKDNCVRRSKRPSVDGSSDGTQRSVSGKKLDEKSSAGNNSIMLQSPFSETATPLPTRPNVLMASSKQNVQAPISPQNLENPTILHASSDFEHYTDGTEHDGTSSTSVHSIPGDSTIKQADSRNDGQCAERTALALFLIKPFIQDRSESLGGLLLSWYVQKSPMQQFDIQNHVSNNEQEGLPPVLHAYSELFLHEHQIIDEKIKDAGSGTFLVSLKRTHVDMSYHGILLKGVPVLHFVLESEVKNNQKTEKEIEAQFEEEAQWETIEAAKKQKIADEIAAAASAAAAATTEEGQLYILLLTSLRIRLSLRLAIADSWTVDSGNDKFRSFGKSKKRS